MGIGSVLVDFDGTAATVDVGEALLRRFADPSWPRYDELVARGEMGLREAARRQAAMLTGSQEEMVAYAVERCPLDPTFPGFVAWTEERGLPLAVVSDGFGLYLQPILEAAGVGHLAVLTNGFVVRDGVPSLEHPHGHPECLGCGTCKMLAVQRHRSAHGPVAFVGEGMSDRYGALHADLVFAKDALVEICERDGVPYRAWETFDDVRLALEGEGELPGPVAPERCPGWIPDRVAE